MQSGAGSVMGNRVDRRNFLLLGAAAGLALGPVAARPARAERRVVRIGLIAPGWRETDEGRLGALRDGLAALGWVEGRDVAILDRWAEGRSERLPAIAAELAGAGVDVLVTAGTPATLAAKSATATIPIVLVGVADPVAVGAVASLAKPDGNVTGLSLDSTELTARRLRLLQELGRGRVAVILRDGPGLDRRVLEIRGDAERIGVKVMEFVVTTGQTVERAFLWVRSNHCDALYLVSGPLGPAKRAEIIALAADLRVPAVYSFPVFVAAGGLMSLAPDDNDLFRRAAGFVDKLLGGAKPADLPVERPAKFDLAINMKTAAALGLTVPPAILARADTVIE